VSRVVGVVASAALALIFAMSTAQATSLPSGVQPDLGSQLMLKLFGETSDANASFAAAHGDRTSESPLRDLALQMHPAGGASSVAFVIGSVSAYDEARAVRNLSAGVTDLSQAVTAGLLHNDVRFAPPSSGGDDSPVALVPSSTLLRATYQPVAPAPIISPEPGTLAFAPPAKGSVGLADNLPSATHSTVLNPGTLQLGGMQFEGHVAGDSTQTPQLSLRDNSYDAGANFNVRAGKRNLDVTLSSEYEQVARNDSNSFSSSTLNSASSWQLPGADAPLVVPNYANLNRLSVGAGVAVPVLHGLTLNLNYGAQHFYGGYGLPGLVNLDTVDSTYGGRLTFQLPDRSSTVSISAYQDRFLDGALPVTGSTQTREDVNFTVKF